MLYLNVAKKSQKEKSLYGEAYKFNAPVSLLLLLSLLLGMFLRRDVYISSIEIRYKSELLIKFQTDFTSQVWNFCP